MVTDRQKSESPLGLPRLAKHSRAFFSWPMVVGLGSGMVVAIAGAATYGHYWVQRNVSPLVGQAVEHFLNRPVELGPLTSVSLTHLEFGATSIPATPSDPNWVQLQGLKISYNPWQYLQDEHLGLNITAVEPQAYFEQGRSGQWWHTEIGELADDFPFQLEKLIVRRGRGTVVSRNDRQALNQPIQLRLNDAQFWQASSQDIFHFRLQGQLLPLVDRRSRLLVKGSIDPAQESWQLLVKSHHLPLTPLKEILPLPLDFRGGSLDSELAIAVEDQQLVSLDGEVDLHQASLKLPQLARPLTAINGPLIFQGRKIQLGQVQGQLGEIKAKSQGYIDWQDGFNLAIATAPLAVNKIFQGLQFPPATVPISGQLSSTVAIQGPLENPQIKVDLQKAGKNPLQIENLALQDLQAHLDLEGDRVVVKNFQALPRSGGNLSGSGQIQVRRKGNNLDWQPFQLQIQANKVDVKPWLEGDLSTPLPSVLPLSGQAQITGKLSEPRTWEAQAQANVSLAGGLLKTEDFVYQGGQWQGHFQLQNLSLGNLDTASIPDSLKQGKLQAQVWAQGNQKYQSPLQLQGQGQVTLPQGAVAIDQFQLQGKQWQGVFAAKNIALATLPGMDRSWSGTLTGNWTGQGHLDQPMHQWNLVGSGQWHSPQGTVDIQQFRVEEENFSAQLSTEGIDWQALRISQPGQVAGRLNLTGEWTGETAQLKNLKGNLTSSQGWQLLSDPVTVAFDWQGSQLKLSQLRSKGLQAQGNVQIAIAGVKPGFDPQGATQAMDLQVEAAGFPLAKIIPTPQAASWSGNLDFKGQVTGSGSQPQWQGQLAVHRLQLGKFKFVPHLSGEVKKDLEGIQLALQGEGEQIRLSLDPKQQPTAVLWERGPWQLAGQKQTNQWSLTARSLPLEALQNSLPLALTLVSHGDNSLTDSLAKLQSQPWGGELSGHFQLDLAKKTAIATRVNIQQPRWGNFSAQNLAGNFRYGQGQLTVDSGRLRHGQSTVLIQGQADFQGDQPRWGGEISFRQSRIEDVLTALQLFTWEDFGRDFQPPSYGTAKDLYGAMGQDLDQENLPPLVSVGNALDDLATQFKQLALSETSLTSTETNQDSLPDLEQLRGQLQGKITVEKRGDSPLAADFSLLGQQWQWGDHGLEQLQLAGRWQEDNLSLAPLELRSGDRFLRVTGSLGPQGQQGQIQLHQLPLGPLAKILHFPAHLAPEGDVFADFRLQGSRQNPQFQGKVQIKDNRFGPLALEKTEGDFSYQAGRLDFQLQSLVNSLTEPLQLQGSVPYVFPFASQAPNSNHFSLALKLKNDSLKLINLFSHGQLSWLSGQGEVDLALLGRLDPYNQTLYQLQGLGEITIQNGAIAAEMLPNKPLTQVNANIVADLNTLQVTNLTGQISGGSLAMVGSLPLQNPLPNLDQGLRLSLNNLAVDVPNLYQGALGGLVQITGTAIAPQVGGQLALGNGNISVGQTLPALGSGAPSHRGLRFNNLNLVLAENVRVQNLPFLDFAAGGQVTLNGTPQNLRPEGEIKLKGGQVNLFASQLRLDNNQNNSVYFLPQRGLDPYLDLYLLSSVSETSRNITNRSPLSSEVPEPFTATQDSLQTVRIQAHINGYASEINQNIQLTSTPRRSSQEIITLLGGGVLSTLGQDSTQTTVGLANLAGSAVLGPVQGRIGEALGLSEFRIFSTPLMNEGDRLQGNQIGVAAEAGIDLTPQLGVSVQKIINSDRLPQWGLEYRVNDSTVIRGSSNFQDDSRGIVEFQKRF
ncbi:translocation/assembly module TamB domain-containing protein [Synechocystis sp. PCC 7338]|uniref:translocation/assembly module TamB domain-containing protein n=1 Tax=Synechocystis sp. PCC 7338 TaxID=2732530 RepID=UPI001BB06ED9|nr:translocation/assembly module TamB domain-containing protein [Synechocystis sp. PCC 7338]QUS60381.1 translocation/assembly module TamB domain-containing protein [Synechocystis sp. PCC 7338]